MPKKEIYNLLNPILHKRLIDFSDSSIKTYFIQIPYNILFNSHCVFAALHSLFDEELLKYTE